MLLNGRVEFEGRSLWLLLRVMTEYTITSHPQQLSSKMFAFCLADLVNLLELEASEQQVVDDILFHENMGFF